MLFSAVDESGGLYIGQATADDMFTLTETDRDTLDALIGDELDLRDALRGKPWHVVPATQNFFIGEPEQEPIEETEYFPSGEYRVEWGR